MPDALIPHEDLYRALLPCRVAPQSFEASVRRRLVTEHSTMDTSHHELQSSWLRAAAALLPLPATTNHLAGSAATAVTGVPKLFGILLFPATTLFLLLGAAVVGAARIRQLDPQLNDAPTDVASLQQAVKAWWKAHRAGGIAVFVITLGLALYGATWAVFFLYLVSLSILIFVLPSFEKSGLASRQVIGPSCVMGLSLLGQIALIHPLGPSGIQLFDPALSAAVLWIGVLLLLPLVSTSAAHVAWRVEATPRWLYVIVPIQLLGALVVWFMVGNVWLTVLLAMTALMLWGSMAYRARRAGQTTTTRQMQFTVGLLVVVIVGLLAWLLNPIYRPASSQRIKRFVESFHTAPHNSVSWAHWEIVARWAQQQDLNPNLAGARRLLDQEIASQQDPFILGSAFRLGLVKPQEISQLRLLESQRQYLLEDPHNLLAKQPILSVEQADWVIRALLMADTLSATDRDLLASRLNQTLESLANSPFDALHSALIVTQLLQTIDRPVDVPRHRPLIHNLLSNLQTTRASGFESGGGFKQFPSSYSASLTATSDAVQLMQVYGVPAELNLDWIRSYLRPQHNRFGDQFWIAAVTRDRFNALPGLPSTPWYLRFYYERSLVAAVVLVALCLYATARAPLQTISAAELPSNNA
jgi:hypothetical protein